MPRETPGGTKMWCARCKTITVCEAVRPSTIGGKAGQRWCRRDHEDVHFFRRGRRCLTCRKCFFSAELREDFVNELVELRDALAAIKKDAEQYIEDSEKTSQSLASLNASLGKLRALELYQE